MVHADATTLPRIATPRVATPVAQPRAGRARYTVLRPASVERWRLSGTSRWMQGGELLLTARKLVLMSRSGIVEQVSLGQILSAWRGTLRTRTHVFLRTPGRHFQIVLSSKGEAERVLEVLAVGR